MRIGKTVITLVCAMLIASGTITALTSCGGSGSSESATSAKNSVRKPVQRAFYKITLPRGFSESSSSDVFKHEGGGTVHVLVNEIPASQRIAEELGNGNLEANSKLSANGLDYSIIENKNQSRFHYIASYEDGSIEVITWNIEQGDVNEFLKALVIDPDAYSKWQKSLNASGASSSQTSTSF